MKKVINGRLYDTETAKLIGLVETNGYSVNDFQYVCEELYRKKGGEYFLYGEGGGLSRYGIWHGNSGGPGEKIMPLSYKEAVKWAETNLTGDEFIEIFGEPDEDDEKVIRSFSISQSASRKLDQLQSESGESLSSILDNLIINA